MIEKGKTYITLITCTPYGINTHRLLVRGEYDPNFDFSSEEYSVTYENHKNDWLWIILVSGFVASGIIGAIIFRKRRREEGEEEKEEEN